MLIMPSFKKSLIVEQFQGNYLKLIYNTLPANDGWFSVLNSKFLANFWTREYRLYWIADVVAKIFELFSDEVRRSLIFER